MTVQELIDHLKIYDPNMPIVVPGYECHEYYWYKEAKPLDLDMFEVWNFGPGQLNTKTANVRLVIG